MRPDEHEPAVQAAALAGEGVIAAAGSPVAGERTAAELDDLAGRLVRLLVPVAEERPPGGH